MNQNPISMKILKISILSFVFILLSLLTYAQGWQTIANCAVYPVNKRAFLMDQEGYPVVIHRTGRVSQIELGTFPIYSFPDVIPNDTYRTSTIEMLGDTLYTSFVAENGDINILSFDYQGTGAWDVLSFSGQHKGIAPNLIADDKFLYLSFINQADSLELYMHNPDNGAWISLSPMAAIYESWNEFSAPFQGLAYDITVKDGEIYLVYLDENESTTVQHFDPNLGTWTVVGTASFSPTAIHSRQIELVAGAPYLSFIDDTTSQITVMNFDGANWQSLGTTLDGGITGAEYLTELNGELYIAFYDQNTFGSANFKKWDGTAWVAGLKRGLGASMQFYKMLNKDGKMYAMYKNDQMNPLGTIIQKYDPNQTTGVQSKVLEMPISIELYPNPVQNILQLDTDIEPQSISIINLKGQLIREVTHNFQQINVGDLGAGGYILRIQSKVGIYHKQFVKQD